MDPNSQEKKTQLGNEPQNNENGTFWTLCPYCYYMYEYDGVYKECCLRCQNKNCRRAFHGVAVAAPPVSMVVEGKEQYYCGIGCFPLKYELESFLGDKKENSEGFKAENFVEISDDSEGDFVNNEKGKEKNGKNSGEGLEDVLIKNGNLRVGEAESLIQGNLKTDIQNDGKKVTRRVKSVAFNTKKLMGRGKKHLKMESSGNLGMVGSNMNGEIGERTEETIAEGEDRKGSVEWDFDCEIDLEFSMGEDDLYVGFKNAA